MRTSILLAIGVFILSACQNPDSDEKHVNSDVIPLDTIHLSQGFNLLESSCFSCHSPNAIIETQIAPTMAEIKINYLAEGKSREDFVGDFLDFMNDPSQENSKIPNAISEYGYMPKMSFSKSELLAMGYYLHYSQNRKSDWYTKMYKYEKFRFAQNDESPLDMGKKIAMRTKSTLGSNLKKALKSKGTEHALSFCSTRAIPLTDSMSVLQNAKVRRVSDKNRNPDNAADSAQFIYIMNAKEALLNGEKIKPQITETENGYVGYYPILSNQMCLQCHGNPKTEIAPQTYALIKELYPEDKAVGYQSGELRGIWVIEMERQ